jgi:molecular chaperone GrpE
MENKEKEIEKVEEVLEETQEEYIEELTETEVLIAEVKELKDKLLRNQAELENFKRRNNEERIRERKYALQYVLSKVIDLNDNFSRALNAEYKTVKELKEGLKLIMTQLESILTEEQVTKIESVGNEFDPNFHQAVMTSNDESLDDDIVSEEFQVGYMYKDRILRPSMVKVNKKGE